MHAVRIALISIISFFYSAGCCFGQSMSDLVTLKSRMMVISNILTHKHLACMAYKEKNKPFYLTSKACKELISKNSGLLHAQLLTYDGKYISVDPKYIEVTNDINNPRTINSYLKEYGGSNNQTSANQTGLIFWYPEFEHGRFVHFVSSPISDDTGSYPDIVPGAVSGSPVFQGMELICLLSGEDGRCEAISRCEPAVSGAFYCVGHKPCKKYREPRGCIITSRNSNDSACDTKVYQCVSGVSCEFTDKYSRCTEGGCDFMRDVCDKIDKRDEEGSGDKEGLDEGIIFTIVMGSIIGAVAIAGIVGCCIAWAF